MKRPIGILCAIPQELTLLRHALASGSIVHVAQREAFVGNLDGHRVALVEAGVGKVNAAVTTSLLIERLKARFIIFTGVAGGLDPGLSIGDVVIAERTIQHDAGVIRPEGFSVYQAGHVPFFNPTDRLGYAVDRGLLTAVVQHLGSLMLAPVISAGNDTPRILTGTILTGDQYLASDEVRAHLRAEFDAVAVEMEGGAVAQAAELLETPHLIVRALSDLAGVDSNIDFVRYLDEVAANSARVVRHLLELLSGNDIPNDANI